MNKVVAVSGGFDPLNKGHIVFLKEAKKLGDKLVVILNKDQFLIKKKGSIFMPYEDRREILRSLGFVDDVIPCIDEDETVCKTLEQLKPDVFANGTGWTEENTPEREICKKLGIKLVVNIGEDLGKEALSLKDLEEKDD